MVASLLSRGPSWALNPRHVRGVSGVYAIVNMVTGKVYVGSTVDLLKRWNVHTSNLRLGKHGNPKLQRAWTKYGADSFVFTVLSKTESSKLVESEQTWIDALQSVVSGYNIRAIAQSNLGLKASAQTRAKQSAALKGKPRNYVPSAETRSKQSAAAKARGISTETREKQAVTKTGQKRSTETKAKLSAVKLGKPLSESHRAVLSERKRAASKLSQESVLDIRSRYVAYCPVNGATAMAKEYGVSRPTICDIISGRRWKI